MRVIGSYLSPYVRKVLAVLELKGLRYEIDPIVPFMGDDRFTALSPLRRVPVLIDDRVTLADSIRDLPVPRGPLSVATAAIPPTSRIAPGPAGSRSMPTRAWATCSSGDCSTMP